MKNYHLILVLFSILLLGACSNKQKLATLKEHNYRFNKTFKGRDIIIHDRASKSAEQNKSSELLVLEEPEYLMVKNEPPVILQNQSSSEDVYAADYGVLEPYEASSRVLSMLANMENGLEPQYIPQDEEFKKDEDILHGFNPGTAFILGAMSFGAVYLIGLYIKGGVSKVA